MAIKKVGMSPSGRLETGAAVLAAAEVNKIIPHEGSS